jgi:hypothetical protein
MKLEEFFHVKKLKNGQFGPIHIVIRTDKDDMDQNKIYAIKCIEKSQVIKYNITKHIS